MSSIRNGVNRQIGFLYGSVVEDYFTGYHLHCRGWTSAYCFPTRPAFLGSVPVSFSDTLIQNKRWAAGLLQVGFSRFSPLTYGPMKRNSVLQSMCYAWLAFWPIYSIPLVCYGTIPQLCFMNGVYLFPPVSSLWFAVFVTFYACSLCQLLVEICLTGGSIRSLINEVRWGMILSVTSHLFACLSLVMKLVGMGEIKFDLTNKATGEEQIRRYERGTFDFEGSSMVLVPATTLAILNVVTLVIGCIRMIVDSSLHDMFGQLLLSLLILAMSYRVLEAIFVRRDTGRVPASISLVSIILAAVIVLLC
ncbi:cellulose synthase-like protein G2 [Iris pallida]|uniref:Cellulose synthase-like protein G2 n=1 Tax=Iris pallida TaxID=29817 RepID=A0AAX6GP98_IRIPA|nr:cellulose synthase-like protein G2 [Iris pallida]